MVALPRFAPGVASKRCSFFTVTKRLAWRRSSRLNVPFGGAGVGRTRGQIEGLSYVLVCSAMT